MSEALRLGERRHFDTALISAVHVGQFVSDEADHLWSSSSTIRLEMGIQTSGHHKAKIDPLNIRGEAEAFGYGRPRELELSHYKLGNSDMSKEFSLGPGILPRFKTDTREKMTLREIIDACEEIYCVRLPSQPFCSQQL